MTEWLFSMEVRIDKGDFRSRAQQDLSYSDTCFDPVTRVAIGQCDPSKFSQSGLEDGQCAACFLMCQSKPVQVASK